MPHGSYREVDREITFVERLRKLPDDAIRRLATLKDASDSTAEAVIALAPLSFRLLLYSFIPPLIVNEPRQETEGISPAERAAVEVLANRGRPSRIRLTRAGRKAINVCASDVLVGI
jgi:hypothetical protein